MLYIVPLESLEERYTEQWSRWIPAALIAEQIPFTLVEGEALTSKVETGRVLDVYGTHHYKFSQLQKIIGMLRAGIIVDGDELWFADLWFPGIEALFYIRNMTGVKFKITGVLHAGTWDKHDFTYLNRMRPWGKYIEAGWLKEFDKVFVGSEFHKNLIMKEVGDGLHEADRLVFQRDLEEKIVVTGLFFDWKEVDRNKGNKEKIVVFPHRLDPEKQPEMFETLKFVFGIIKPDWQFIRSKDVCKTKEEYFQLLGKSEIAVSFAQQETFGYAMLEACANGCIPVVPGHLSYEDMQIYRGQQYVPDSITSAIAAVGEAIEQVEFRRNPQAIPFGESDLEGYTPVEVIKKMFPL